MKWFSNLWNKAERSASSFRWTLLAFVLAGGLIAALVVWQLLETSPTRWCILANDTGNTCQPILLRLLDIKDHSLMGLLTILGLTVLSVVVVALGVKVQGTGPGGITVDIESEKTTVSTEPGTTTTATVEVKTPPTPEAPTS